MFDQQLFDRDALRPRVETYLHLHAQNTVVLQGMIAVNGDVFMAPKELVDFLVLQLLELLIPDIIFGSFECFFFLNLNDLLLYLQTPLPLVDFHLAYEV